VRGYALAKEILATGCETYGAQYGLRWLHCILATVYGPHAHAEPNRSHFMMALIARAAAGRAAGAAAFEVWGSLDTVRDLLYVSDQIEAVLMADAAFDNTIVNCTANAPVTIGDCARAVLTALDWHVPIVTPADSFRGTRYKSLDSSRFLAATRWRPRIGLAEGVERVLAADFAAGGPFRGSRGDR
jgi:GDP-L-fucose synthase